MNKANCLNIQKELPKHVTLVTVSKQHTKAEIEEAYACGCRIFGENKVQELKSKYDPSYTWHMIGHLQRNKVKEVVGMVAMIQSLDSLALAKEIEKQCAKLNKVMPVLVEVNVAQESTKTGIPYEESEAFVKACQQFPHVSVQGLMCIGPHCEEEAVIKTAFESMHELFIKLQSQYGKEQFRYLSMGMSSDYRIAIACGSTMVRLGSILMGERDHRTK